MCYLIKIIVMETESKEIVTSIISPETFEELRRYSSLLSEIIEKVERLIDLQNKIMRD